jgi:hypothetical protein
MRKKIFILFVLACLVVGGGFLYEHLLFEKLSAELETQTKTITLGYNSLVTTEALPLSQRFELNTVQNRLIQRIKGLNEELKEDLPVASRIEKISALQTSLSQFVTAMPEGHPEIVTDASFAHVQEEMGERGHMRPFLEDYNSLALKWNRGLQSELGSLTAGMREEGTGLLPYLRFDGNQEYVPVIGL